MLKLGSRSFFLGKQKKNTLKIWNSLLLVYITFYNKTWSLDKPTVSLSAAIDLSFACMAILLILVKLLGHVFWCPPDITFY